MSRPPLSHHMAYWMMLVSQSRTQHLIANRNITEWLPTLRPFLKKPRRKRSPIFNFMRVWGEIWQYERCKDICSIKTYHSFLGYEEDLAEPYTTVQQSLKAVPSTTSGGETTYKALNGQGRRALTIIGKKQPEYFINLMNAFKNFNCLLPSNLEIGIRIYLASPEKYFTTTTRCKPRFKILEAKLLVEFILLKPVLLQV